MRLDQKIIHHLILQYPFIEDIGLFYGKMGVAIFFYEYSAYVRNKIYSDIGYELLSDIWNNLSIRHPFYFDSGLCGIGWGIEYLIQNKFIVGDSNDICEEIDRQIMQINLHRLDDKSIDTGLDGILYYVSSRLRGNKCQKTEISFDSDFIEMCFGKMTLVEIGIKYPVDLYQFINNNISVKEDCVQDYKLGLKDGVSGFLLNDIRRV